jgi:4-hydroxybenzoate polyprenyltransferase
MAATNASRWWVYQRERFPILAHGVLIAVFSLSAVTFSSLLRGEVSLPRLPTAAVAFGTALLFFFQLRVADEFKDFEEDLRFRPYRPVQRGLVSLRELGVLGGGAALIQLGLALWLAPSLVLLLALVWAYLVLMSKEFFIGDRLRQYPVVYLLSHMVIIPLIDLYATACDWWARGVLPAGLTWFVLASYGNGVVLELGRKIRSPADEESGVNTYSSLWGRPQAVLAWLATLVLTGGCAMAAAHRIGFSLPVGTLLAIMLGAAGLTALRFLQEPCPGRGKRFENLSAAWTLLMYLGLGLLPLLWRGPSP